MLPTACAAPSTESVAAPAAPTGAPATPPRSGRPEILAPAGDWDCARAAIENGADAIYFGLDRFNARMRAHNFTATDLPALMDYLHRRGARGYVTFNTLVFSDELADAADYLRTLIAAGVDAAIVQDVGICRLIRELSPDFPIHCSTQMTITSAAGVEFARALGAQLVVLARENSLAEIDRLQTELRARTSGDGATALPLEVFVHGALCVAYSGQCLTSESLGGRSANRGECAQACRMPYDLVSDGRSVDLGGRRYLLSPQDLAGIEVLPELVRLGIASLKIEGRLKSPEYVANITRVYRQALDRALAAARPPSAHAHPADRSAGEPPPPGYRTDDFRYDLEMAFSRGLSTGWFHGIDNQHLVHARFGTKRGAYLGRVGQVTSEGVLLHLEGTVKPGDGVVFDAGRPEAGEEGGRIYGVERRGAATLLTFGRGDVNFARVQPGDRVWKTSDPELDRRLRQSFAGDAPRFQRPVHAEVHGHAGAPLTLLLRDELGHTVRVDSAVPLVPAERQPLDSARLHAQLGRLGGTPFRLETLTVHLEGAVLLPLSELNRLRREAVAQLEARRAAPPRWTLRERPARAPARAAAPITAAGSALPELIALVRTGAQLEAAWHAGVRTLYCEFEDPKRYREAVASFRRWCAGAGSDAAPASIWVAPPRVTKPGEEWILRQVRSCEADGYLVRNYDHLLHFAADRRRGDFSLNVANELTAAHYLEGCGLERVTASYDLNVVQLEALLQAADPARLEITLHQHMPMFHMEHCVFCAFLSQGKDFRDCGRPCDRHDVRLRDRVGAQHPLKADAGCRNTVFNARAQTGAEFAHRLLALGARAFRLEFLLETPDEVARLVGRYRQLLAGEITGEALWREFKLINQLGVTRGQLEAAPQALVPKTARSGPPARLATGR
jgi:putative protease